MVQSSIRKINVLQSAILVLFFLLEQHNTVSGPALRSLTTPCSVPGPKLHEVP